MDQLRTGTSALHTEAERSGIIREILRGMVSLRGYTLFLRNLHPAYRTMEAGLDHHRQEPAIGPFALPSVYRAAAIEADLLTLQGEDWCDELPLLPAATYYAAALAEAAEGDGTALIGHAYARYLGDLSGGQILKRLLSQSLGIEALSFFEFPAIGDMKAFKQEYRAALVAVGEIADSGTIINAAVEAFRLNIQLSEAVLDAVS